MHLVFLNQYYPPDAAPTGVMLETVVEKLAADGHRVTVLCAEGGYAGERCKATRRKTQEEEERGRDVTANSSPIQNSKSEIRNPNLRIVRIGATKLGRSTFAGKMLDYASYYIGVSWKLMTMHPRPERIIALTTPPYLSVLARFISKLRGGDHSHWVMDVYPDVMVAHGMLRKNSLQHHLLRVLARWGCGGDRCAAVVTLGPDMEAKLKQLCPETGRRGIIRWVPLWNGVDDVAEEEGQSTESDRALALRRRRGWSDLEMIVMYSGNMGLGHRFHEILNFIGRDASTPFAPSTIPGMRSPLRFVFFGGGRRRVEIEEFMIAHRRCAVELHDYVPREELAQHLRSADLHLVSLDPSWTGSMLPSKLQGIFAAARPVIFIGDEPSSVARWIQESGGGWVVNPGDIDGLTVAIDEARIRQERMRRGQAAKVFSMRHFDRRTNAGRVAAWLACERQGKGRCLDGLESPQDASASDGSEMHRSWVPGKDSAGI
jgi:colanic acid biosynthesis glycosyl transferase WcaI